MSRSYNYTTGNFLYYLYHQKYYNFIGIYLLRKTNTSIPQQINLLARLEEDDGFLFRESSRKLF